jgi:hypothetical protein
VRRLAATAVTAAAVAAAPAACGAGTVRIAYAPPRGARATYRVTVHATTLTRVQGQPERRTNDDEVLAATHEVLSSGQDGSRVRVTLVAQGGQPRTYVVRLDRAAQLAEVQLVEGVPATALGDLGLSEIFPAAAGAPPTRPLAPGERWTIDQSLPLGGPPVRLTGAGRLVSLGVVHGWKVATLETHYSLPVDRATEAARLIGTQTTATSATRRLADGTIDHETATTTASYRLLLLPPAGSRGPAIPGTLDVTITSDTRRTG